jgi:hypothetical protein
MINKEENKSQPTLSKAYLEELAILQRKIEKQEKAILKIAKELGVELFD